MIPSPITWFTVPSYWWMASIIRSSTGSRSFRASSGSRSASSSMEPLRSAKRTVTCLRSPSRAALDVRIFSARCFGVYASGDVNRGSAVACDATGSHTPGRTSRLRAARYDTSRRSALHGLRTPGRTSPVADSRAGTGDTSLPSLRGKHSSLVTPVELQIRSLKKPAVPPRVDSPRATALAIFGGTGGPPNAGDRGGARRRWRSRSPSRPVLHGRGPPWGNDRGTTGVPAAGSGASSGPRSHAGTRRGRGPTLVAGVRLRWPTHGSAHTGGYTASLVRYGAESARRTSLRP
jgi:hypothetical protein